MHDEESSWVVVGGERTKIRKKSRLTDEKEVTARVTNQTQMPRSNKPSRADNRADESTTRNNQQITVIVGDSIIKNVQGIKLAEALEHRVVVKSFPGATICDMQSHIII